jgi:phage gp36-like protein
MADFTTDEITKLKAIAKKEKDDEQKQAIMDACSADITAYIKSRESTRDTQLDALEDA